MSEGYKALFKTFPDYKMVVYPTRRTASYPDWFYAATKKNATSVELTNNGFGFCCSAQGYPFPIPKNGTEVMWNHIMRYNTVGYRGYVNHAQVQADGSHVVERAYVELTYVYNNPKTKVDEVNNQNLYLMVKTVSPPNKAGDANLLHVPIDRVKEITGVWLFNPSQGRVRRIGEVGYDNPLFDGLMTHDQLDMFNGPLDRYSIKLLGKKEMLVPYNGYRMYSDKTKYKDIIKAGHINQDLTRYELHRVWQVQATLKAGQRHIYAKRDMYFDEDTWQLAEVDHYDGRGQLWRVAEGYAVNDYERGSSNFSMLGIYDLIAGRYNVLAMTNQSRHATTYGMTAKMTDFTPAALRNDGIR